MATVVTPHSASQSAMATRSQELAPKRRTFAGLPTVAAAAGGIQSGGTQTMCMSEWTSIPAALGLSRGMVGGCARGGRGRDFGGALLVGDFACAGGRWCRLMVSAPWRGWGEDSRRRPRGAQEFCTLANGIDAGVATAARRQ